MYSVKPQFPNQTQPLNRTNCSRNHPRSEKIYTTYYQFSFTAEASPFIASQWLSSMLYPLNHRIIGVGRHILEVTESKVPCRFPIVGCTGNCPGRF